jgi:arylsulfatase A-like enzyme
MLPTLLAAAGEPDIVEKLKKGHKAGNRIFNVHIDGYNLPFLKREATENPRKAFLYWSDDGDLMAIRAREWKAVFMEQRARRLSVWREPFVPVRFPKLFNLRSDPFERGNEDGSVYYGKWLADRMFAFIPTQAAVGQFLTTFEQFPPRQKPGSFSIDEALEKARERGKTVAATAAAAGGPVRKRAPAAVG